jgi:protein-disulfide isomerase
MIKFLQKNAYNILLLCACIIVFGLGFVGYQITRDVLVVYKNRLVKEVGTQVSPQMPIENADEKAEKPLTRVEVEEIVKEHIMNNPSVIVASLESMHTNKIKEQNEKIALKIKEKQSELFDTSKLPYSGNPEADVKIAIFQDYRCGYCKKANVAIDGLLQADGDVLVVYHLFPILGADSVYAAKAALAIYKNAPHKFKDVHEALMLNKVNDESNVNKILEANGIKPSLLKEAIQQKEAEEMLNNSYDLAKYMEINGAPAIILDDQLFPGAVDLETLKKIIAEYRSKNAKKPLEEKIPAD